MSDPSLDAIPAMAATGGAAAGPGELKRSNKLDFAVARERSFLRPNAPQHQCRRILGPRESRRKSAAMPSNRGKPTMEIYRPPIRTDIVTNGLAPINARLNVHAKEFTMKPGEIATSRSSSHVPAALNNHINNNMAFKDSLRQSHYLQTSKSSGNILHSIQQSKSSGNVMNSLSQSVSSGNIVHGPRVHFQLDSNKHNESHVSESSRKSPPKSPPKDFGNKSPFKSCSVSEMKSVLAEGNKILSLDINDMSNGFLNQKSFRTQVMALPLGLKRSKSLGAADMLNTKNSSVLGVAKEAPDLGAFSLEVQTCIQRAVEDPNKMSARLLMELVRHIMDRVVGSVSYALPAAKLCITIIEKEKKETFLESLLNTCQQWYHERERVLRSTTNGSNLRYCAFMQFLNEMYCELKRRQLQLKTQYEGVPPGLVLLTLLYKCCQDCLKPPSTQGETDSLFFVLTSVGRDLEQELPSKLQQLLCSIRDAFLTTGSTSAVKKTLLQLIELHASKWQLPASAVMYYTTNQ